MMTPSLQKTETNTMPESPKNDSLGVYLRSENNATPQASPKELDVLWSQDAPLKSSPIREDHHPLLTFVAGLLTGVILTTLFFWVFNARPQPTTLPQSVTEPPTVIEDITRASDDDAKDSPVKVDVNGSVVPAKTTENETTETQIDNPKSDLTKGTEATAELKGSVYKVKPGDTLGGIANKFYGSSSPAFVDRIQKANKLGNKHSLALDQELVIPPKNY
jgi:LysM repeat protein